MGSFRVLIILLFSPLIQLHGSHLLGGQWTYTYLGSNVNGEVTYAVTLTTYTDCTPQSEIPIPENPLIYAIYENVTSEFKPLTLSKQIFLSSSNSVEPNLPTGCTLNFSICLTQAVYSDTITLAPSPNGYILFYERCCRSSQIISLNGASLQSESFIAIIPPTHIHNTTPSPIFQGLPLICLGDTLRINNFSTDPDGDIVIYNWAHPYSGYATPSNTIPLMPNPLAYEPPLVSFTPGFSSTQPLGQLAYHYLNSQNGYMEFTAGMQGSFVVAYEAIEFRNNVEINRNRREFQITATICPTNSPPQIAINPSIAQVSEEEISCFEILISDADTVTWSAQGSIFQNLIYNIDTLQYSGNDLHMTMCVFTECGDFSPEQLWGFISANDKGCIPKQNTGAFSLIIDSIPTEINIQIPDTVCLNEILTINTNTHTGNWQWLVSNAAPIGALNQNTISIQFNSVGNAIITVYWNGNCNADTITKTVEVIPAPFIDIIGSDSVCQGQEYWYSYQSPQNISSVNWFFNHQYISNLDTLFYAFEENGWLISETKDPLFCKTRDSMFIHVLKKPDRLPTDTLICYNQIISISIDSLYTWNIQNPIYASNINSHQWEFLGTNNISYAYTLTDKFGCKWDSIFSIIVPNSPIQDQDTLICPNDYIQVSNQNQYLIDCFFSPPPLTPSVDCVAEYYIQHDTQIEIVWIYSGGCNDTVQYIYQVVDIPPPSENILNIDTVCDGITFKISNPDSALLDSSTWNINHTSYSNFSIEYTLAYGSHTIIGQTNSKNNCHLIDTFTISIPNLSDILNISLPNIITPNSDGLNDNLQLKIPGKLSDCTFLEIRNRWGQLIEKTKSTNWAPKSINDGIYYLIIQIGNDWYNGTITVTK